MDTTATNMVTAMPVAMNLKFSRIQATSNFASAKSPHQGEYSQPN